MKKVVLFALLLATVVSASAQATIHQPQWGAWYYCDYSNYSGNADDPGYSYWLKTLPDAYPGGNLLIRGTETFTTSYGTDTYKAAWAHKESGPSGSTLFEFTFNPSGPQCKRTLVYPGGYTITFAECTDGHTRICSTW